jgi:hypothetical protein
MADEEEKGPEPSAKWLAMLKDAEDADKFYHEKVDHIDDLYADLKKLADMRADREFQIFWANLEVLKPSIYTRPPVPVVSPRFKDRRDLPRKAADILERALIGDVEADHLHDTLVLARDDLAIAARGVIWVMKGERDGVPVAVAYHLDRKDFRHEPARKWSEVGWCSHCEYFDRKEVKAHFKRIPKGLSFEKREIGDFKGEKKAACWCIWHKADNKVVWVAENVGEILSESEPDVKLTDFFPCPKPAYGTLQRGTLTPVPDFVYYRDQVEEINAHTNRIAALTKALKMRGFYPAGISDVGTAIETAMKRLDDEAVLIPVDTLNAMGPGMKMGDAIAWLPVVEIMQVIQGLIEQRRVLIEDVYQLTGLSDIMRGSTDANETLGAQQLKSQYGSVRVKERQSEMQRLARDVIRIKAEIMAENVPIDALLEMSQVDDLPREADIQKQMQQVQAQAQQAIQAVMMQAQQAAMQPPQQPQPQQGQPMPQGQPPMPPQGQPMPGMPPQGAPM